MSLPSWHFPAKLYIVIQALDLADITLEYVVRSVDYEQRYNLKFPKCKQGKFTFSLLLQDCYTTHHLQLTNILNSSEILLMISP